MGMKDKSAAVAVIGVVSANAGEGLGDATTARAFRDDRLRRPEGSVTRPARRPHAHPASCPRGRRRAPFPR
ncbi:phage tail tape-measure protein [Streptomyces griseochromogenes]|uniref:Phage tail tape-measure protein n=1 Tax=Streptomyces griseochromogenes TaxID=68214 RepID=A0ABS4M1H6_9ACTN|nr:phage tail tape-measure protein [Streptomyces griseochromogenes]